MIDQTSSKTREISQLLADARQQLVSISDTPALDSQVLLAHLLDRPRAWLLAHGEYRLSTLELQRWEHALALLIAGEPLPYILGRREFYGLEFTVTPQVLIPRPETEMLVAAALSWLQERPGPRLAADIGTGSGCIGISLAVHQTNLSVLGCDLSLQALRIAGVNASRHAVADRFFLLQSDLLPPISRRLDLICANLPYIPTATLARLAVFGREPTLALDGGPDGLLVIRRMFRQSQQCLAPGGLMLLEIDASHGQAAQELAYTSLPGANVELHADLAGLDRMLWIETAP